MNNLETIYNATEDIVSAMISGEIPQEAMLSFTKDFWEPMSPTSTDKYFIIQKSDNPNGEVSPLIGRNPELFEILIGSNVQPSDFFEVSLT
jgi:hypothetical protein